MSEHTTFRKNPDFVPRQIGGEWILVPLKRLPNQPDALYVLNDTGGFLWAQLIDTATPAALRDQLTARFDVAPEQAAADVERFLQELAELGALQPAVTTP